MENKPLNVYLTFYGVNSLNARLLTVFCSGRIIALLYSYSTTQLLIIEAQFSADNFMPGLEDPYKNFV